jgi:hypothetical protein
MHSQLSLHDHPTSSFFNLLATLNKQANTSPQFLNLNNGNFQNLIQTLNQIVPSNFDSYWKILNPLMKEKYQTDSPESAEIKKKFFELVVSRDNVGEALWFIYTGLLLTSIVQLKITSKGCVNNPKVMEQNYQKFLDDEKQAQQQKQQATSTTYTITN